MSHWKTIDGKSLPKLLLKWRAIPRQVASSYESDTISTAGETSATTAATLSIFYTLI